MARMIVLQMPRDCPPVSRSRTEYCAAGWISGPFAGL